MNPIAQYQEDVEFYVAQNGGDIDDIDTTLILDCFYVGMTIEEAGKNIIKMQQEQQRKPEDDPQDPDLEEGDDD